MLSNPRPVVRSAAGRARKDDLVASLPLDALRTDLVLWLDDVRQRSATILGIAPPASRRRLIARAEQLADQLTGRAAPEEAALGELAALVDLDDPAQAGRPLAIVLGLVASDAATVRPTDAARLLGITPARVYQLIADGKLRCTADNPQRVYRASIAQRLATRPGPSLIESQL
jgi:hypothetical protein